MSCDVMSMSMFRLWLAQMALRKGGYFGWVWSNQVALPTKGDSKHDGQSIWGTLQMEETMLPGTWEVSGELAACKEIGTMVMKSQEPDMTNSKCNQRPVLAQLIFQNKVRPPGLHSQKPLVWGAWLAWPKPRLLTCRTGSWQSHYNGGHVLCSNRNPLISVPLQTFPWLAITLPVKPHDRFTWFWKSTLIVFLLLVFHTHRLTRRVDVLTVLNVLSQSGYFHV